MVMKRAAREEVDSFGGILVEKRSYKREIIGRSMKGPMTRTIITHALSQRRSAMMMDEVVTKLLRGSSVMKRFVTHLIQRRRKMRRCIKNLEVEGITLGSL